MRSEMKQAVVGKLNQWANEARNNAIRAKKMGRAAVKVVYPTGLTQMRFAEPMGREFGMHYEVDEKVWMSI